MYFTGESSQDVGREPCMGFTPMTAVTNHARKRGFDKLDHLEVGLRIVVVLR